MYMWVFIHTHIYSKYKKGFLKDQYHAKMMGLKGITYNGYSVFLFRRINFCLTLYVLLKDWEQRLSSLNTVPKYPLFSVQS